MRVLLDECLPRRLKQSFGSEHQVTTVPERGWAGINNGELPTVLQELATASGGQVLRIRNR